VVQQSGVVVALGRSIVSPGVGVAAVVGQVGQEPVERLRVTQLILRERAHRHVLLEHRRDAGPLRVGEADDELVVGHGEEKQREGVPGRRHELGGRRHPGFAFGLRVPAWPRAVASLSRIT
jgi:hypothetical protein